MTDRRDDMTLEEAVSAAVRAAEARARDFYRIDLPAAELDLSLRGRCAGQARVEPGGRTLLRLNRQLLAENLDDFLARTVPHEVAHLVVFWQTRARRRTPRPHGAEWQAVMRDCFGLEPTRCHAYRTTPARVVPKPFLYACACREHRLTAIMHKRLSRTRQALCTACRAPLRFVAREEP